MTSEKSSTVDLLRHGAYVRFLYVRIAASIALQVQAVAVGWLMYELTRSPFQLGLVGLVQFIPSIGLFLAPATRRIAMTAAPLFSWRRSSRRLPSRCWRSRPRPAG